MFTDDDGTVFAQDPTGRYPYRALVGDKWTNTVTAGPGQSHEFDPYQYPRPQPAAGTTPRMPPGDSVGVFLETVGWLAAVGSTLVAVVLFFDATDSANPADGQVAAITIGVVGTIQALLLVGFGRVVGYLCETAAESRRSADLLAKAVDAREDR